ncbi:response regulator transcription factor [Neorhizobium sp. JUb45]|uniref:helix-turn-helix domain-containing protein n=1 Tax=unclassified Neorhizobium TaxID=2629175 RepID=UPI0010D9F8B8|nr:response regulator transcription factor [Neorhizobium sp. JUb45]TCQ98252.1 DNA-binding NarL/FixJ family response regulator [Neorhizobium sp. JUb45]
MLCDSTAESSKWSLLVGSGLRGDAKKTKTLMDLFQGCGSLTKVDSNYLPRKSEVNSRHLLIILDLTSIDNADSVINHLQIEFPDARFVAVFDSEEREAYSSAVLLKARYGKPHGFIPVTANPDTCAAILCVVNAGGEIMPWTQLDQNFPSLVLNGVHGSGFGRVAHVPPAGPRPEGYTNGSLREFALTEREKQVLRLLMTGMQNKVIANKMAISENTVRIHIHHILRKLGVRNRTEATNAGIRSGFISLMLFFGAAWRCTSEILLS